MTDYIIVGCGLAGIAFSEIALSHDKAIVVFNDDSQNSSAVAAGLYNPVILKRFSALQNAQSQISLLREFYAGIEKKLNITIGFELPVLRKFFSAEEQNNWFSASDKPGLSPFLSTTILYDKYEGIDSPFGFGEVLQTGYVDTSGLMEAYKSFLVGEGLLRNETFEHDRIVFGENYVEYKGLKARNILFAEGFGLQSNPFFNHLPLDGTKGELFIIKAPGLGLDVILNTNVFILPLGNGLFKAGATYNWDDKTQLPTQAGRQELVTRIREVLDCDFEIIDHLAGIRPTVKDRRALIGTHAEHKNLHLLNGLGTRGVMLGPYMAKLLFENIEYGIPLEKENDIKRFDK